jgi:cysteine desulfurase/selenocysteine lyase
MLGPKGIGVLWGRPGSLEKLEPLVVGGGSIRSVGPNGFVLRPPPEGLEGGTPNVTGAVGLAAAIDYLETLGRDAVARHSRALAGTLRELLLDLPVKRLLMSREGAEIPVGSIVPREDGPSADQLALLLSDSFGVMTRSGLQCAHPLFADLGAPDGALRVSAYVYNDVADISCFAAATARLLRRFGA